MAHPNTGEPYVRQVHLSMTLSDKEVYDNAQRLLRAQFPNRRRKHLGFTMRDLIFKLLRVWVAQRRDELNKLWAEDQTRGKPPKGQPKITLH